MNFKVNSNPVYFSFFRHHKHQNPCHFFSLRSLICSRNFDPLLLLLCFRFSAIIRSFADVFFLDLRLIPRATLQSFVGRPITKGSSIYFGRESFFLMWLFIAPISFICRVVIGELLSPAVIPNFPAAVSILNVPFISHEHFKGLISLPSKGHIKNDKRRTI